jgi:flagellar biogenesis protein FliO
VLTLAVAIGVLWWARRLPRANVTGQQGTVPLRVTDAVSLGAGCSLHLLQVEQTCYVVGVDGTGLKAIHLLSDSFEQLLDEAGEPPAEPAEADKAA